MSNESKIFSVKQLTKYIKQKLETDFTLGDVWIRGEISNFTHHSSGHMYFTLKDEASRIRTIMFASQNQRLQFIPKEGTLVLARGTIGVYERDGQYQFYVREMQPDGTGNLFLAFEKLKASLEKRGLFAQERKRTIPAFPKGIGIVTSPTGAAIRDMITTIQRRYPAVPIYVVPATVQGTGAAPSIVRGIQLLNRCEEMIDVMIVGRGGGSLEELWAFNEEEVALAIAASSIPVISAVGHETDFTIADFVADIRAATPSVAAELAVPNQLELLKRIQILSQRLQGHLLRTMNYNYDRLQRMKQSTVFTQPQRMFMQRIETVDRMKERLEHRMVMQLNDRKQRLGNHTQKLQKLSPIQRLHEQRSLMQLLKQRLHQKMSTVLKEPHYRLQSSLKQLDALSPLKVMQRGYSVVYNQDQTKIINSKDQVQLGDAVKVRLQDGMLECQVWAMEGDGQS